MKNEITDRDINIILRAEEVVDWMKEKGWAKVRKCPDPVAADFGFNDLIMELIDAVDNKP